MTQNKISTAALALAAMMSVTAEPRALSEAYRLPSSWAPSKGMRVKAKDSKSKERNRRKMAAKSKRQQRR